MVIGEDISPGMKRGGWLNQIKNTLNCTAKSEDVPRMFKVDISLLDVSIQFPGSVSKFSV